MAIFEKIKEGSSLVGNNLAKLVKVETSVAKGRVNIFQNGIRGLKCNSIAIVSFTVILIMIISVVKIFKNQIVVTLSMWDAFVIPGLYVCSILIALTGWALIDGLNRDTAKVGELAILLLLVYIYKTSTNSDVSKYTIIRDTLVLTILMYSYGLLSAVFRDTFLTSMNCGDTRSNLRDFVPIGRSYRSNILSK